MTPETRILRLENQIQALVRENRSLLTILETMVDEIPETTVETYRRKMRILSMIGSRKQSLRTIQPLNGNTR